MKILIVIAPEGYQDFEYETPKKIIQNSGHEVITASTKKIAKGSMSGTTEVDILLNEANPSNYDGILFVGGPGSHLYFHDKTALALAKSFYDSGKIVSAICAAPSILANAGILKGKVATCFPGQSQNLLDNKSIYTGNPLEQDGKIITANGPSSAQIFGQKIVEALNKTI